MLHGLMFNIIQVHDFIFNVKIQLPAQEAAEVLVDEIIKLIPGGKFGQVPGQHGARGIIFRRRKFGQLRCPGVKAIRRQNGCDRLPVQITLLLPPFAGPIFKADIQFTVFHRQGLVGGRSKVT